MAKDLQNQYVFEWGEIFPATKLEVITIGLGRGYEIGELTIERPGKKDYVVFRHEPGHIVVSTKEHPEGSSYDANREVVVRVLDGKVLIHGQYDLYCPDPEKVERLLGNPFELEDVLTHKQLDELTPLFLVASKIRPSIAPAEPGRRVIPITHDMVGGGALMCHCSYDPEDVLTSLYEGDFFLVSSEEDMRGYRIGREEFEVTHKLD